MPFREVVGHRALVRLIARAVDRETLPPSLLFVGPEGVGKRLVATALAQALNCTALVRGSPSRTPASSEVDDADAVDACGRCSACSRVARGLHPDVVTVAPGESGAITIDEVRQAMGQAVYRPFEGRRRVVVIDDADRLVPQAQNALLKTLEEPPASSQFVLVTARPDTLLATVRSRCQRLRFGQLGAAEVSELLVRVHGYDENTARVAAASADGSIGRALRLASGELAAAREAAVVLLRAVATARDPKARLEGAKGFLAGKGTGRGGTLRRELAQRLRALASLLRDVALVASGAGQTALANIDLADRVTPLAQTFGGTRGVNAFQTVDEALAATERNASPKVVADWVACRL